MFICYLTIRGRPLLPILINIYFMLTFNQKNIFVLNKKNTEVVIAFNFAIYKNYKDIIIKFINANFCNNIHNFGECLYNDSIIPVVIHTGVCIDNVRVIENVEELILKLPAFQHPGLFLKIGNGEFVFYGKKITKTHNFS